MAVRGRAFLSEHANDNRSRYYKGAISEAHLRRSDARHRIAMPNYRHAFVTGGCWFFTVNLLERRKNASCRSYRLASRVGRQDAPQVSVRARRSMK